MQQTFELHTQKSMSFVLSTQKAGKKKRKKGVKKVGKNTPIKHIAIYTRHMLIIIKNYLEHVHEPVLLLS
jgi:hypothetical protein